MNMQAVFRADTNYFPLFTHHKKNGKLYFLYYYCQMNIFQSNSENTLNHVDNYFPCKQSQVDNISSYLNFRFRKLSQLSWLRVWMYAQTTQILVLVKANLGAYFFLNKMPPNSSQVSFFQLQIQKHPKTNKCSCSPQNPRILRIKHRQIYSMYVVNDSRHGEKPNTDIECGMQLMFIE